MSVCGTQTVTYQNEKSNKYTFSRCKCYMLYSVSKRHVTIGVNDVIFTLLNLNTKTITIGSMPNKKIIRYVLQKIMFAFYFILLHFKADIQCVSHTYKLNSNRTHSTRCYRQQYSKF